MSDLPYLEITGNPDASISLTALQHALNLFCKIAGVGNNTEVSLVFCTSEEMRKINLRYRGANKSTDVISFPAEGLPVSDLLTEKGPVFLGEILIDTNYITTHPDTNIINEDVRSVFIHGLLHLAGYDHMNASQSRKMKEMEDKIMQIIKQEGRCE